MPAQTSQPSAAAGATPAMAQWFAAKEAHPDALLFFRMGDFYELFFSDAEAAAAALDIVLSHRGEHNGIPIPMCGVPKHAAEAYLARLIRRGYRVAVAEQMEDPKTRASSKVPIRREIVRLITPGTLTEDSLLEAGQPNLLVALARGQDSVVGAAWLDISTGVFETAALPPADLPALLGRLEPAEIIAPETLPLGEWSTRRGPETVPSPPLVARRRLAELFQTASIAAFGVFNDAEAVAAMLAVDYVRSTQAGALPRLARPVPMGDAGVLAMDAATRASLEIHRARDGGVLHTLLAVVKQTVTPAGARLLGLWLAAPLTDPATITVRQDAWSWMIANPQAAIRLRAALRTAPDLARALGRLSLNRGGPRDLAAVRDTLAAAREAAASLEGPLPEALSAAHAILAERLPIQAILTDALTDPAPLRVDDGGTIRPGYDGELDGHRSLRDDSRRVLASMQLDLAQKYGVASLKIRHHSQLGYVIEVPAAAVEGLRAFPELTLRQGMANGARFTEPVLSDLDRRITEAADRAAAREKLVFAHLTEATLAQADALAARAEAIALLDVAQSAANLAAAGTWCRPVVTDDDAFLIRGGRHPVVEAALAGQAAFVPNMCDLSPERRVLLLTGPNMAGKLTFLRQNALMAVLAQAGLPVPAEEARIGIVDRLFSRVGAADDLARGRSTFMVEMTETAAILNQAGPRSLVVVDEIGRGTATTDGLAIAWAVLEALHSSVRCRTIFATHFHELAELAERMPRIRPHTMRVKEWRGSVVFLHEVAEGAAGRSWGVHVAELAGVPKSVVRRAASLLSALEKQSGPLAVGGVLGALPLFAAAQSPDNTGEEAPPDDELRRALAEIDPDRLTPREALDALYRLRALLPAPPETTINGSLPKTTRVMLNPIAMPKAPEAAAAQLSDVLAVLAAEQTPIPRDAAIAAFRRHLARIQNYVRQAFEQEQLTGLQAARLLGALVDGVVSGLYEHVTRTAGLTAPERLSVAATGGYGRGVLAPFSDIDLLFLTGDNPDPATLQAVEYMLYFLWDLGLKVGHATRSIDDCLTEGAKDTTIRTALLDARYVTGDKPLFADFHRRFRAACKEAGVAEYIAAKQGERAVRHRRYGDSPFMVEPNVKEGRGGLRDIQTLYWIARYVFDTTTMGELADLGGILTQQEARHGRRAWEFLWTVRFHLHYVAGRAEERLTFDMQPVVGARMGYTRHGKQDGVERFMRHYFLNARDIARLTRILEPAILRAALGPPAIEAETDQALLDAGFVLAEGKLLPLTGRDFDTDPIQMLRVLVVARDRNLELHPLTVRSFIQNERRAVSLRDNKTAAKLFMDLLCGKPPEKRRPGDRPGERPPTHHPDGAKWLTILNETGFLGRYLPDWGRIVGQMQFDTYHIFTVDEHTIEAVKILNAMERGELAQIAPVASELVEQIESRRALYMAMIMHDICKGRGGDHSELGAELALEVCPGLGMTAEETETVSWLVLHHLLLSATAFKRDIDDPKTILDLAETIQSPERLRLLLILTVADMRAVSSKVWNGWKATLLRELYARVAEVLAGGLSTTERDVRVQRAKQAASALLVGWSDQDKAWFTELGYPGYWLSFDPDTHARHARLLRDAEHRKAPLTVDTQPLPARAVTEVTIYAADHPGLFSKISGALAVAGASIVDARIHTMTNGMALDTFWIQDAAGGTFDQPHRLAKLSALIEQALSGRLRLTHEIRKLSRDTFGRRMRAIHAPPRVVVDNHASNTHTILEVNGRDRPGLLHDVTAAISEQGLQIASAHVTTYGVRAVDVFYVKDVFGLKVENDRKLALLREGLLKALETPDEVPSTKPRVAEVVPRARRRRIAAA